MDRLGRIFVPVRVGTVKKSIDTLLTQRQVLERDSSVPMYPKDQALRLAEGASQPVLTTQAHTTATTTASK